MYLPNQDLRPTGYEPAEFIDVGDGVRWPEVAVGADEPDLVHE